MSRKLFAGNLSLKTTESDLGSLFTQVGEVKSVRIITDFKTGYSRGFGFVEMNDNNIEKALSQLNGTQLHGHTLTVSRVVLLFEKSTPVVVEINAVVPGPAEHN